MGARRRTKNPGRKPASLTSEGNPACRNTRRRGAPRTRTGLLEGFVQAVRVVGERPTVEPDARVYGGLDQVLEQGRGRLAVLAEFVQGEGEERAQRPIGREALQAFP